MSNEAAAAAPSELKRLALVSDIPDTYGLRVQVDKTHIALFKVKGEVFAMNAICPHAGAFLEMGYLEGHVVLCPLHGWDFDVRNGESPSFGIKTSCYPIEVRDGVVYLKPPAKEA
jgi:nitrite reductase/ring-hydroxylating ferredoxin subunit